MTHSETELRVQFNMLKWAKLQPDSSVVITLKLLRLLPFKLESWISQRTIPALLVRNSEALLVESDKNSLKMVKLSLSLKEKMNSETSSMEKNQRNH